MKVTRKLTLPGRRESEYSGFEIEIEDKDLSSEFWEKYRKEGLTIQDTLQVMCREAQARVLACHVADGSISNDEMTFRLKGFLGETPKWLRNTVDLKLDD